MSNISLRIRIMLGFLSIIALLGIVNLLSVLKLQGLDQAAARSIERTEIVRHVNDYVSDIIAQKSALRTFAFSSQDSDKKNVEESRKSVLKSWQKVSTLLRNAGDVALDKKIKSAADKFEKVFVEIENRLGNDDDALQVIIVGVGKLRKSASELRNFLLQNKDKTLSDLAHKIRPVVARVEEYSIAYASSSRPEDFDKAIMAGQELDDLIRATRIKIRKLPRSEQMKLRYMSRDWDVIRQSLRQKNAIAIGLDEALSQLSMAAKAITGLTGKVKQDALDAQSTALNQMLTKVSEVTSGSIIGLLGSGLLAIFLAWFIGISITKPLSRITQTIAELAAGEKSLKIPYQDRRDEIGHMARAASVFQEKAFELEKVADEKMAAEIKAVEEKRRRKEESEIQIQQRKEREAARRISRQNERQTQQLKLADQLENEVAGVVTNVAAMAGQLGQASTDMKGNVDKTNHLSTTAANKSEQTRSNVMQVSSAMEKMEKVLKEVSKKVDRSKDMARKAVDVAEQSQSRMQSLSNSADQITSVIKLIRDIADQTNLLALNATIEAARAGDAGKGFAVVASEVKSLAAQTAQATKEIEDQVSSVTSATGGTVETMNILKTTIEEINEMSQMISASVDDQTHTSRSIKACVNEATQGVGALQNDIQNVNLMAKSSEETAINVWQATAILEEQSSALEKALNLFLSQIRSSDKVN